MNDLLVTRYLLLTSDYLSCNLLGYLVHGTNSSKKECCCYISISINYLGGEA